MIRPLIVDDEALARQRLRRSLSRAAVADLLQPMNAPQELVIPAGEFDLAQTLESGQCFRWQRLATGEYWGVVRQGALYVRQEGDQLRVQQGGGTAPINLADLVHHYFDFSGNYRAILRRLRRDETFAQVAPRRASLHILRQEPFEVLISFVISANNHIPRIRSIIERLCRLYGSPLATSFGPAYTFPTPEALAQARLEDLRLKCGLGYRDGYVQSVARTMAAQPDFARWAALPTAALRQRLLQLDGVGEKVADCVLLFGFHRLEAFPLDTWIRRAMTELYFPGQRPRRRELQACAARQFGAYAGIAQQYLFVSYRQRMKSADG